MANCAVAWRKASLSMLPHPIEVIVTCEHGGNQVPPMFRSLFSMAGDRLASHRGWDPGALELARRFARSAAVPLITSRVTRLLVDLNRSLNHPSLFSSQVQQLDSTQQSAILTQFYHPYRDHVRREIDAILSRDGVVLHLSIHTFTPELDGEERPFDIGLLYDPARQLEVEMVDLWGEELRSGSSQPWSIRRNEPYLGTMDGLAQSLREVLPRDHYIGIELEVNQLYSLEKRTEWLTLQLDLVKTFNRAFDSLKSGC